METEAENSAFDDIVRLQADDLPKLRAMLVDNALPADDCEAPGNEFFGIFDDAELIAAGGLESAGDDCLLRSLVVKPGYRNRGLAQRLTTFLLARARAQDYAAVYLLTETAADYFSRLGFTPTARDRVPPAIAATRQFAQLCPDSAVCLTLPLAVVAVVELEKLLARRGVIYRR